MFDRLKCKPTFIQPVGLQHYRFVRLPDATQSYEVWRGEHRVVACFSGITLHEITRRYRAEEAHERATASALASGKAIALCGLGWHRLPSTAYVRFGAGTSDAMRVYRIGRAPYDFICTTVWAYAKPVLVCTVCGNPVDAEHGRGPLS